LSSFSPIRVLKGKLHGGKYASIPRKILVVGQFTVSLTLIISTIVVYNQIMFAKDRPVGYTREGLIMIQKRSGDFNGKAALLREELKKTGMIEELAESGGEVTNLWSGNSGFSWKGKSPGFDPQFGTLNISPEYGKTVGWQFVAGRDFSPELASDSAAIVINESAAKVIGLEHPVGEVVHWKNKNWRMDNDFTVIGIIKDMVMESPYEPTEPTVFLLHRWSGYFNIKLSPGVPTGEALLKIEDVFRKIIPTAPFEYTFADEEYNHKFETEERIGKLASVFSVLAIVISCLGLFGLASFVAEQRTKELGIRKVLGASVLQLWKLLSVDFLLLVVVACGIAIPFSMYFMNDWLNQFEYRSMISWTTFGLVVLMALAITVLTVSYQALRAAFSNPVDSLRTE
jgi:putative ABC transport system permease protein